MIKMNIKLLLFTMESVKWNSFAKRYRFAVVDLGRSKSYPENYVCMLPADIGKDPRNPSSFAKIFGDRSTSITKQLLVEILEVTTDTEAKAEIERRLKALTIYSAKQVKCAAHGNLDLRDPKGAPLSNLRKDNSSQSDFR
jgi:hypothetical protein